MGLFSKIKTGIFGGKKKKSKSKSSGTSDYDPWDVAIPAIKDYLGKSQALYNGGAPMFSADELAGYAKLRETVGQGATAINPAIAENNKTLSGAYLDPASNPYLKEIADRMGGVAGANANASFAGAGRTGSGLAGYYSGKGAADATGEVYFNNYNAERGRMGAAVGMAPQLEAGRYLGPQALISAGQNQSARPFDINQQYGNILTQIGQLGQQGKTTGETTGYGYTGGLLGKIANSFANKLFG